MRTVTKACWSGAVLAVALSGCAGVGSKGGQDTATGVAGKPSGSLRTMGFGGDDEVGQARVALFKQTYPDVSVSITKGDFDAQQFLTAVASGNPPDLVYMDRNLLGTYAAKGAVQDLSSCVSTQGIDMSQYRPAAVKSVTYKDKVYGIPEFYVVTATLIDAKDLAASGVAVSDIQTKDWAALKSTSDKLHKSNGGKLARIGFDPKLPEDFPLWASANGATIVNDDGSPNLNDPKAVEALTFAASLVADQGGWASFKAFRDSFDIFGAKNPLSAGAVIAFPMENWYVNVLTDFRGNGLKLESTPFTDRQGKPISMVGGSAWAIPKGAKNPTAACAWMKTLTSKEAWMKAAEARSAKVAKDKSIFTGLFTANTAADEQIRSTYVKDVPDAGFQHAIENYYATLDSAKALPPSPAGAEIDTAWRSAVERVLSGQSAQASLDRAQKEAQTAYDKAKNG